MREVKYRGKRIDNGEWVEGNYVYDMDKHFILTKETSRDFRLGWFEVDPATVGESTGHPDGYYEGDILSNIAGQRFEVVFDEQFCSFKLLSVDADECGMKTYLPLCSVDTWTLEGNRIDDPELLKEQP